MRKKVSAYRAAAKPKKKKAARRVPVMAAVSYRPWRSMGIRKASAE